MNNNTNKTTNEHSNDVQFPRFNVEFEAQHGLPENNGTPEKEFELIFMDSYFCVSAVFFAINRLSFFYKNEDLADTEEMFEACEYLSFIGLNLLRDMSCRTQKSVFLKRGENK